MFLLSPISPTKVHFYIRIDGIRDLYISMSPNVALTYSAYILAHKQCLEQISRGDQFYNIAAYSSKRLYENARMSVIRVND